MSTFLFCFCFLFLFCFFLSKLILFYNKDFYYYTRIFLILLSNPVHTHTHTHTHIYIYIYIGWLTVVKGNPKGPFSIATTQRCSGGRSSFLWIFPLSVNPYLIMLSVKQGSVKYHFLSLWYDLTRDWTPVSWTIGEHYTHFANIYIYIYIYNEFQCYWVWLYIITINTGFDCINWNNKILICYVCEKIKFILKNCSGVFTYGRYCRHR